ncbi:hypothetical protein PRZ48_014720 [Zasmidium cellare]|uniref:FAD-binding domain-containing protein n=1 Tax=Zasmidium cellare TaxID=395010 RepID=A0ABR0DZ34_ZASCE|nr:hypothetical protein PRZ48_014720 [Zasmidium cellare]
MYTARHYYLGSAVVAAYPWLEKLSRLWRLVKSIWSSVTDGKRVKEYFEDNVGGKAGVVLESGEIRVADVVIAADGLRSASEDLIPGEKPPTKSSGMSIYRIAFPRELAMKNELVRQRWQDTPPMWEYWLGPGMYMGIFSTDEIMAFGFTPRDTQGIATESWEPDTDPEDVVKALKVADWDPAIVALVRTAPKKGIVHWPLLWRDLRREWTSEGGRVVQVGDSAHTFTPTSGNGATQALEDAVTLATCLEHGGKQNAGLATKIYNLLRFQRVSCAQKMTFVNAQLKTETNWDTIWKDPKSVKTRFPKWVWGHDPEEYAYEKYGQAFAHLVQGAPFENTNFPPGHKFKPWTMEEVYRDLDSGVRAEDLLDGDWS